MNARRKLWGMITALVLLALGPMGAALAQQVKVSSADPASTTQGTTGLDVTIAGSGFDASAAVKFLVTGTADSDEIEVTNVVYVNSKKLVAKINARDEATVAKYDIEVTLSSGRKGKGTTLFSVISKKLDPCYSITSADAFPAFILYRMSGSSRVMYVADRSGTCVRLLGSGITALVNAFSYPVLDDDGNPTNRGRVAWSQTSAVTGSSLYLAMDFDVNGTSIVPGAARVVMDLGPNSVNNQNHCCGLDLSRDGRTLYVSLMPTETSTTMTHRIGRLPLPASLADVAIATQAPVIYEAPLSPLPGQGLPVSGVTWDLTVDYDSSWLYLVRRGVDTLDELVRLDLHTGDQLILTGPRTPLGGDNLAIQQPGFPAAELTAGSRRVAFREWIGDTTNSDYHKVYFIDGTTGVLSEPAQRAYGHVLSWSDGMLLGNGYDSRNRPTGKIVSIDPTTGAVTSLVTGQHPQGR